LKKAEDKVTQTESKSTSEFEGFVERFQDEIMSQASKEFAQINTALHRDQSSL
jgi:hypothetical protein